MSLRDAIRTHRQSLLDLDMAVDDARARVNRENARLEELVAQRDAVRDLLERLVGSAHLNGGDR